MKSEPVKIPKHIAIIMDGNGRWAKERKLSRFNGHHKGATIVREIVTECRQLGVQYLTLYAFSEENWNRPPSEISVLMKILKNFLVSERGLLQKNDVRLTTIGNPSKLPKDVQKILKETMLLTQNNASMTLILALSYGGRDEITRGIKAIADQIASGALQPSQITQQTVSEFLDTANIPDPDLMIRTSGEKRTSNFLPWQSVYSELYITDTLWPDFGKNELLKALVDYSTRERRFGLTSEQLATHQSDSIWRNVR